MIKLDRNVFVVSLAFIIFAVILGALGAHALAKHLTPQKLASFETGVRYQLFHGIGLIALIAISNKFSFSLKSVYLFLIFGVIFFFLFNLPFKYSRVVKY